MYALSYLLRDPQSIQQSCKYQLTPLLKVTLESILFTYVTFFKITVRDGLIELNKNERTTLMIITDVKELFNVLRRI